MPKASLRSDKALQAGFGIQEGVVKVMDARFKIVQRSKKDGTLVTPMLLHQWDVTKCDAAGVPVNDEEISQKDFIFCWGSKEAGDDGEHKFSFHPANGENAEDMEPADQGAAIDTEGNTVVPTGNATAPFADADVALIMKSLEARGFKPEINDQCYAPNYVGLVMEVRTVTKQEFCKTYGVRYNQREGSDPKNDTVWEVVKILQFPGEKGKGKGKSATTPAATSKANGKEAEGSDDEALAAETVRKVAASKDFKGKEDIARSKFQAACLSELHKARKQKQQAGVMKLVKDDDWLINAGGEIGFIVDTDEGKLSFTAE